MCDAWAKYAFNASTLTQNDGSFPRHTLFNIVFLQRFWLCQHTRKKWNRNHCIETSQFNFVCIFTYWFSSHQTNGFNENPANHSPIAISQIGKFNFIYLLMASRFNLKIHQNDTQISYIIYKYICYVSTAGSMIRWINTFIQFSTPHYLRSFYGSQLTRKSHEIVMELAVAGGQ